MFTILTPNEESFLRSFAETTQAKFVSGDMFCCLILRALATVDAERQAKIEAQRIVESLAERVAAQSELLSRRAEHVSDSMKSCG
jgi:hypothetical protein